MSRHPIKQHKTFRVRAAVTERRPQFVSKLISPAPIPCPCHESFKAPPQDPDALHVEIPSRAHITSTRRRVSGEKEGVNHRAHVGELR